MEGIPKIIDFESENRDEDEADLEMALRMRQINMQRSGFSEENIAKVNLQGECAKKILEINSRMERGEITEEQGVDEIRKAREEILGM